MANRNSELWWLVAIEATLFFSLPAWEATAPWAEPATFPLRFGVTVFGAATAAMLACHVGPAALAARFGGRWHPLAGVLLLWLSVGYLERILIGAWTVAVFLPPGSRGWWWIWPAIVFLAIVTIAGLRGSWWKPVAAAGLVTGLGILGWAVVTTRHGLSVRNPYFAGGFPFQFDGKIFKGMLLSAAPAVVIGWRIGRIWPQPARIWWSGIAGVWLPLVVSVTIASLADQAGANLYWVPSLSRGFNWALLGPHVRSLQPLQGMTRLLGWTLLGPAVLSAVCLGELRLLWTQRLNAWRVPIAAGLLMCAVTSIVWPYKTYYVVITTPVQQFWAGSLVVLGASALAFAFLRRSR